VYFTKGRKNKSCDSYCNRMSSIAPCGLLILSTWIYRKDTDRLVLGRKFKDQR